MKKLLIILRSGYVFGIYGFVSGMVCGVFWDPDDYGLIVLLMPGWLFAVAVSSAFSCRIQQLTIAFFLRVILWVIVSASCFLGAFYGVLSGLDADYPLLVTIISTAFPSTLIMMLVFKLLFGTPKLSSTFTIAITASVIAYLGILFFLVTESTIILFIFYHTLVALLVGASIEPNRLRFSNLHTYQN